MIETGVLFDDIHSFHDLNLILAPFTPAPATPKTNYVEVAGSDEPIDLTEAFGKVNYNTRDFQFTFTIHPSEKMTFDEKVTQVSNALNGKRCKITLDRDSGYYWKGRCTVNQYKQDGRIGQIVVNAKVNPYKMKHDLTVRSFSVGDADKNSSTKINVVFVNGKKSAVPTIECDGRFQLAFGALRLALETGIYKIPEICFECGENHLIIIGLGTITFSWQEGEL